MCLWTGLAIIAAPTSGAAGDPGGATAEALRRADAHWADRASGQEEGRPSSGPIDASIAACEDAMEASPDALEPRWKLLRALHFAGEFVETDEDAKRARFERATGIAEETMDRLAEEVGGGDRLGRRDPRAVARLIEEARLDPNAVARLHFWAGIHWGAWSRTVGLLSAVRQGVGGRLHRYTELAVELEPGYDEGGPLRLLGSLHAELPKVPFLTGWVDRDEAMPLLERARSTYPEHPGNRLLLAKAILELQSERRDEAESLLRGVATDAPRPDSLVEDIAIREQARELLAAEFEGPDEQGE